MRSSWKRALVPTFIVLLGLFSLAVTGFPGDPRPSGEGYSAVTFYVA